MKNIFVSRFALLFSICLVSLLYLTPRLVFAQSQLQALPKLNLDFKSISVSGVSSGAAMAQQLAVAYPEVFSAVGVFAGPVWNCAQGNSETAQELCMKKPENISLPAISAQFDLLSAQKLVGSPDDLKHLKIYIWHGQLDSKVHPHQATLTKNFWAKYVGDQNIRRNIYMKAEHLFPTLSKGGACNVAAPPFIGNCGFDAVHELFDFFYGFIGSGKSEDASVKLFTFDQTKYIDANSLMGKQGYAFIPQACKDGEVCKLHVALHGCKQSPEFIDNKFAEMTGYIDWATSAQTVILFPAATTSTENPFGCWDWWGYTGKDYQTRSAPQIKSIINMISSMK